jgi:hypothetical protein
VNSACVSTIGTIQPVGGNGVITLARPVACVGSRVDYCISPKPFAENIAKFVNGYGSEMQVGESQLISIGTS